jgi:hypothetical protein
VGGGGQTSLPVAMAETAGKRSAQTFFMQRSAVPGRSGALPSGGAASGTPEAAEPKVLLFVCA